MELKPPPGYLPLRAALSTLLQRMHRSAPSKDIQAHKKGRVITVDAKQATAAAKTLYSAIENGDLTLFALFASRDTPMRIHNFTLIKAALAPPLIEVMTFAFCGQHPLAPFGLSWSDFNELIRDPLFLDRKQFFRWLKTLERKEQWPCVKRKLPGRPTVIDEVIEVIEELRAKGEISASTPVKVAHAIVQSARPSLSRISVETVRRAVKQVTNPVS